MTLFAPQTLTIITMGWSNLDYCYLMGNFDGYTLSRVHVQQESNLYFLFILRHIKTSDVYPTWIRMVKPTIFWMGEIRFRWHLFPSTWSTRRKRANLLETCRSMAVARSGNEDPEALHSWRAMVLFVVPQFGEVGDYSQVRVYGCLWL